MMEDKIMKILLNKLRREKGITLEELAVQSGISKSTLNRIENEITFPTMNQMEKLAIALGVKISDLYDSKYK